VSKQNRLLDRHRALHGSYWKSYDFAKGDGKAALVRHPLGPVFKDHPFPGEAFEHDGGEIIFHLPNGLQGYLLVDKAGKRIDDGPLEIVHDKNEWADSPLITNGLSCMGCHKDGMKRFEDKVRAQLTINGAAREKADELFADSRQMKAALDADEERFLTAALRAMGPFLEIGSTSELRAMEWEPIGTLARFYQADLGLATVIAELEAPNPDDLKAAIRLNAQVRQILGPLLDGLSIKRAVWEAVAPGIRQSPMQQVARELNDHVLPADFGS
jgi:serine/threonine-protein kinase